jgi:hypothetical protein
MNCGFHIGERILVGVTLTDYNALQSQGICNVTIRMFFHDNFVLGHSTPEEKSFLLKKNFPLCPLPPEERKANGVLLLGGLLLRFLLSF